MANDDQLPTNGSSRCEDEPPCALLPWRVPTVPALRAALDTQSTTGSSGDGGTGSGA